MNQIIGVEHVSFLLVFLEGVLSFFSPCVLPILPIYLGFLAGQSEEEDLSDDILRRKLLSRKVMNILFFGLGISLSFFVLGLAFTSAGQFFSGNKMLFSRIGGIIIILLGLYQIGFYKSNFLNRERRLPVFWQMKKASPFVALLAGFTFSFAWTPCVGPMLSSVLIMASGAKTALAGRMLVLLYGLGFLIPFVLFGIFTTKIMSFFEQKSKWASFIPKIGGVLLIIMGISVFTGYLNGITGYLNAPSQQGGKEKEISEQEAKEPYADSKDKEQASDQNASSDEMAAPIFSGTDQNGVVHRLEDYEGKVIFLNFWATWCGPCNAEIPDVQELYEDYGENKGDVIVLGVVNPRNADNPHASDIGEQELRDFIQNGGYRFPSIFDASGDLFSDYQISAFPTTFIIDKNGNITGYAQGALTKDIMVNAVEDALKK